MHTYFVALAVTAGQLAIVHTCGRRAGLFRHIG